MKNKLPLTSSIVLIAFSGLICVTSLIIILQVLINPVGLVLVSDFVSHIPNYMTYFDFMRPFFMLTIVICLFSIGLLVVGILTLIAANKDEVVQPASTKGPSPTATKFCTSCGRKNEADAKFCSSCAKTLP